MDKREGRDEWKEARLGGEGTFVIGVDRGRFRPLLTQTQDGWEYFQQLSQRAKATGPEKTIRASKLKGGTFL